MNNEALLIDEILKCTPKLPPLLRVDVPNLRAVLQKLREEELKARKSADDSVKKLSEINLSETKYFMKALAEEESLKVEIESAKKEFRDIQKWQVSRKRRVLPIHLPYVNAARCEEEMLKDRAEKGEDFYAAKKALDAAKADVFGEERREAEVRHLSFVFLYKAYAWAASVTQMIITNREAGMTDSVITARYHKMVKDGKEEKFVHL